MAIAAVHAYFGITRTVAGGGSHLPPAGGTQM
jgi:hypothetical protein